MRSYTKNSILAAMFLAVGIVLPFLTGQLKEIGDTLLPMHIPVMLCGLICGSGYGFMIGLILPVLRAVTVGMPPLYPNAIWMAAELAAYGFTIGFLNVKFRKRWLYVSLLISMITGRVVWGIVKTVLLGIGGKAFTLEAFITGGIIDSFPGIVLQFILIPVIIRLIGMYKSKR